MWTMKNIYLFVPIAAKWPSSETDDYDDENQLSKGWLCNVCSSENLLFLEPSAANVICHVGYKHLKCEFIKLPHAPDQ